MGTRCVPELEISDVGDNWLSRVLRTTVPYHCFGDLLICRGEAQDLNINVNISFPPNYEIRGSLVRKNEVKAEKKVLIMPPSEGARLIVG